MLRRKSSDRIFQRPAPRPPAQLTDQIKTENKLGIIQRYRDAQEHEIPLRPTRNLQVPNQESPHYHTVTSKSQIAHNWARHTKPSTPWCPIPKPTPQKQRQSTPLFTTNSQPIWHTVEMNLGNQDEGYCESKESKERENNGRPRRESFCKGAREALKAVEEGGGDGRRLWARRLWWKWVGPVGKGSCSFRLYWGVSFVRGQLRSGRRGGPGEVRFRPILRRGSQTGDTDL